MRVIATTVSFNGTSYSIPANREPRGWGTSLSSFLVDVANSTLSKAGGSFTLTADANFGATYGLVVKYLKSSSSNISSTGVVRFANNEGIAWRNAANSADLDLKVDAGNRLEFNAVDVVTVSSTDTLTNKTLTSPVLNSPTGLVKADVGLGNVDNTSDATKNSAAVTLTNKTLTSPVINTPTGIVKGDVGLGSVDNTSDATKNSASVTLTNKTINGSNNTITNVSLTTGVTGTLPAGNGGTGITSLGTGVATALGANVTGSGGAVLATSPTIATPTITTSATSPLIIGGTGTTSTLILRSTSGVGTTGADVIIQAGNNGGTEIGRGTNAGAWTLGPSTVNQNHTINGTFTANRSSGGATAVWSFNNTGAANAATRVELSALGTTTGTAVYHRFLRGASGTTNEWDVGIVGYSSTGNYEFASAGTTLVGSITQVGAWTLGTTAMATNNFIRAGESTQTLVVESHAATASSTRRIVDARYNVDADCTGGYFFSALNSSSTVIGRIEASSNTTTSFTGSSDSRLKQNPSDFNALPLIAQMIPREYEWKSNPGNRQKGFYAQELHTVYPDAVSVGTDELTDDGSLALPWGIDYSRLTPVLVKAVQEQQTLIQALEARLAALEAKG